MHKVRLGDIAKITNGKSDVKDALLTGDYAFFDRSVDIKRSNKYLFDAEAIIIAGEDSRQIFEPRYFKGKFDLHQRCYVIYDVDKNYDSKYLFYRLKTLTKHFANVSVGSTVPSLRLDNFTDLRFDVPDLDDQKIVARMLAALDAKIKLNKKVNSELEVLVRELFNYWFVQFEFPDENGRPYKTAGGAMEYNEKLNREIPADWTASALDDFISLERGISYTSKSISTGDGMPMINLASIDISRNYRVGTLKYFAGKYKSDKIVTAGDMLIACTDLTRNADIIGSPILVPREHKEYLYSMDLSRVVSKGLTDVYLYESLRTESYHNYIKHFASGTNVLHLDLNGLRWYKLPVPPSPLQESFANIVKPLRDKQAEIINENQKLIEQRDFLLPMLMNRQIGIAG